MDKTPKTRPNRHKPESSFNPSPLILHTSLSPRNEADLLLILFCQIRLKESLIVTWSILSDKAFEVDGGHTKVRTLMLETEVHILHPTCGLV